MRNVTVLQYYGEVTYMGVCLVSSKLILLAGPHYLFLGKTPSYFPGQTFSDFALFVRQKA